MELQGNGRSEIKRQTEKLVLRKFPYPKTNGKITLTAVVDAYVR